MSKDRRKVKGSAMARLLYDFVPNRVDATVYMNHKIDVTEFVKFMKKIKKENEHITYFHGLVTMLGKTIYSRPKMNYFVQDRKLYEHTDVSITFVAKEKFEDESVELQTTVKVKPEDTLYDISDFIYNQVKKIRASKASGIDNVVETLGNMPNVIRVPIMGLFKWLDKSNTSPVFPKAFKILFTLSDGLTVSSVSLTNIERTPSSSNLFFKYLAINNV